MSVNRICAWILQSSRFPGDEIIFISSHNARRNVKNAFSSYRSICSLSWALSTVHSAASGFAVVSKAHAAQLRIMPGRWRVSVKFPKLVPDDLECRTGGMIG